MSISLHKVLSWQVKDDIFLMKTATQLCLCDLSFSMWVIGTNLMLEHMMTSFSLRREEEERVTAKI